MGKGSSQQNQVASNPAQLAQQPYLTGSYDIAKNLYQNNPTSYYPGQTLAQSGTAQQGAGYDQQLNAASWLQNNFLPGINSAYSNIAGGSYGGANSPAYGGYQQYAQGGSYPQQQFQNLGQTAYTSAGNLYRDIGAYAPIAQGYGQQGAQSAPQFYSNINAYAPAAFGYGQQAAQNNNLGLGQLGQTASGYYLNSNPYIDKAIQAAQDPVTRNYQTAIAPGMDATLQMGGRYGSGAMAGMYDTSQQNLARGLGDISTNMMNANYARERQAQDAAAGQYGQLYNQGLGLGITGAQTGAGIASNAADQYYKGLGLGITGASTGAGILNNAAGQYWTGLGQANANAQGYQSGQMAGLSGLQGGYQSGASTQLDALRSAPQFAGMQFLGPQQYVQGGQGLQGIQQQQIDDMIKRWNETQQDPWKNLSMYQQAIGGPIEGSKSTPYYTNKTADTLGTIFGAAKTASTIAPMIGTAAAAWIVCTELMRQKRMPKRWWLTGSLEFAGYPDAVKRGYYVWAIPSVRHLRKYPTSLYSRFLGTVFRWRAEDIAARKGVAGARRLRRGRAVTAALWLPCLALGACVPEQDWRTVYRDGHRA